MVGRLIANRNKQRVLRGAQDDNIYAVKVRGHEWGTRLRELGAGELLATPLMPQVRGHERGTRIFASTLVSRWLKGADRCGGVGLVAGPSTAGCALRSG